MRISFDAACRLTGHFTRKISTVAALLFLAAPALFAKAGEEAAGGEANLKLPDLSQVSFLGIDGHKLLVYGLVICVFGLLFGLTIFRRLKNMEVHRSMREISE